MKKMDPMLKLADKDIIKSRLQLLDDKATRAHTQMAYWQKKRQRHETLYSGVRQGCHKKSEKRKKLTQYDFPIAAGIRVPSSPTKGFYVNKHAVAFGDASLQCILS
jgi:hypothetical protein